MARVVDIEDATEELMKNLGLSKEEVEEKLASLDVDDVIAILDDMAKGNIDDVRDRLGIQQDEQENIEEPSPEQDDKPLPESEGMDTFKVGEPVQVGDTEGVVKIVSAPSNTMGIMIDGVLKMVDRKNVSKVTEGVLGMTEMLGLRRMQELAGISTPPDAEPTVTIQPVDGPEMAAMPPEMAPAANPVSVAPAPMPSCLDGIMDLFDQIEGMMMELPIKDAKCVRERIMKLSTKLNESKASKSKALKEEDEVVRRNADGAYYKSKDGEEYFKADYAKIARETGWSVEDVQGRGIAWCRRNPKKKASESVALEGKKDKKEDKKKAPKKGEKDDFKFGSWLKMKEGEGEEDAELEEADKMKDDPCWDGYKMVGTKEKGGKEVPNCVPESRKSLTDYIAELNTSNSIMGPDTQQTIGLNQNDAVKNIAARLGGKPQDTALAQTAFQKLRQTGMVKNQSGKFQMNAMSDDALKQAVVGDNNGKNPQQNGQQKAPGTGV